MPSHHKRKTTTTTSEFTARYARKIMEYLTLHAWKNHRILYTSRQDITITTRRAWKVTESLSHIHLNVTTSPFACEYSPSAPITDRLQTLYASQHLEYRLNNSRVASEPATCADNQTLPKRVKTSVLDFRVGPQAKPIHTRPRQYHTTAVNPC